MTMGNAFWILMLLWIFVWAYWGWANRAGPQYGLYGGGIIIYILIAILGWHDFGPPIHG